MKIFEKMRILKEGKSKKSTETKMVRGEGKGGGIMGNRETKSMMELKGETKTHMPSHSHTKNRQTNDPSLSICCVPRIEKGI